MVIPSEVGAALERGTIASEDFGHREHVMAAWWFLEELPVTEALRRMSGALRRFAASAGHPGKYHETITWAYLFVIAERRVRSPGASWEEFAARNADLFERRPGVLDAYYTPERLGSDLARTQFLLPDRPPERGLALECAERAEADACGPRVPALGEVS